MIHSKRSGVNKGKSARKFKANVHKSHPRNVMMKPMRGGWRL